MFQLFANASLIHSKTFEKLIEKHSKKWQFNVFPRAWNHIQLTRSHQTQIPVNDKEHKSAEFCEHQKVDKVSATTATHSRGRNVYGLLLGRRYGWNYVELTPLTPSHAYLGFLFACYTPMICWLTSSHEAAAVSTRNNLFKALKCR